MRTGYDLIKHMMQLFHDGYIYCMDVISPEGQNNSAFNFTYRDDIDTYFWQCSHSGKIIVETMDDTELQNIYHTVIKSKNEKSIRLIEMTMKDRALAKMGIKNDKVDLQKLKESVDIVDLIHHYVGDFRYRPGALIKCPLPAHKDGTSSFSINQKRGLFHCFGCGLKGSQIDFIMHMTGYTISEAIKRLSQF